MSHELIAGAASYEVRPFRATCTEVWRVDCSTQAAKAWENHVAENGEPEDHAKAKEIM